MLIYSKALRRIARDRINYGRTSLVPVELNEDYRSHMDEGNIVSIDRIHRCIVAST